MNRRHFITSAGTVLIVSAAGKAAEAALPPKSPMGVARTAMSMHLRKGADGKSLGDDPVAYLDYCRSLGAGGVQFGTQANLKAFKRRLEQLDMFYEGECNLPAGPDDDMSEFEAQLTAAKYLGAPCVRAVSRAPKGSSGRRYESFKSGEEWRAWMARSDAVLEKVVPIAERIGMPLALENHKDRLVDEHVATLKKFSSRHLGALIDPGNNMALAQDPWEVVEKLSPYVLSTSLKDMAVAPYEEGFLLSEVLFDTGINDQAKMFAMMRAHNPRLNPIEEIITRDPLRVPVYRESYWASWPDRPGLEVARFMEMVRAKAKDLPRVDNLPPAERLQLEEDNNRKTFDWGRTHLKA